MAGMTQTHLDLYGIDKSSGQDSCCSSGSRIPLWFGLIGGVAIMVFMIAVADSIPLYIASAFGFVVASFSFHRLFIDPLSSTAAAGHAGPPAPFIFTSPPSLSPPTVTQSTTPPMPMQFGGGRINVAASTNLTPAQPVQDQQAPVPEQTHGVFVQSDGAEETPVTSLSPDSAVAVLSMASADDLAEYMMKVALRLTRDYTHSSLFMYQAATDIWVQNHLGQPGLSPSLAQSVEEAHKIVDVATGMFVEAMQQDLQKIYGDVCDARGLQCERPAVAKSLLIWTERYNWYYDQMKAQVQDWETIEAYLDHINAFIAV